MNRSSTRRASPSPGGASTAALKLLEDAGALDSVLVPCGGGGLAAATAVVMSGALPKTAVYAVQPELFDDPRSQLEPGERIPNPKGRKTFATQS
ncbi:MAG: pyridoxal-phosphate dependent enzyme [Pseudomonadota bacterium]